ncbi:MAG: 4Fe-4S dicluster domain-containing protein [Candidatus Bathyarchaeota archaeon]|nr:4Fe-4S dicluster domain-containing protein [Candidatus Bathyarchaeota archaeon]
MLSETQEEASTMVKTGKIDPKFKYNIMKMPGAEKISLCFQCGTCTADCAIARFTDLYKPRKIARIVQLGLKNRLISDYALWLCTTCFTCVDHCPQGVEVSSIVRALRNISVKERKEMPLIFKVFASNILKTGYVYVMPESRLKKREAMGLPPLPKPNLDHIAKIFDAINFSGPLQDSKTFDKVKVRTED